MDVKPTMRKSPAPRLIWDRTGTLAGKAVYVSRNGGTFRIAWEGASWAVREGMWWATRSSSRTWPAASLTEAKAIAEREALRLEKEDVIRWTPTRHGAVYCSAGCGGSCTWHAYCDAVEAGKALAQRLGDGWAPHVWENLGWHYSAVSRCGQLKVHKSYGHGYVAYFGAPGAGGRWTGDGGTPAAAVNAVLRRARAERDEIATMILAAGGIN